MTTATSVFVSEPGDRDVLQVREHDVPAPGAGEVQVEVAAAGVNFIDVYKRQGIYPVPTPFVLGEEGAGTVVAVGPEVSGVAVGDRVAWCQSAGSMSTLTNKPADKVVPVPDGGGPRRRGRSDAAGPHRPLPRHEHVCRPGG